MPSRVPGGKGDPLRALEEVLEWPPSGRERPPTSVLSISVYSSASRNVVYYYNCVQYIVRRRQQSAGLMCVLAEVVQVPALW